MVVSIRYCTVILLIVTSISNVPMDMNTLWIVMTVWYSMSQCNIATGITMSRNVMNGPVLQPLWLVQPPITVSRSFWPKFSLILILASDTAMSHTSHSIHVYILFYFLILNDFWPILNLYVITTPNLSSDIAQILRICFQASRCTSSYFFSDVRRTKHWSKLNSKKHTF